MDNGTKFNAPAGWKLVPDIPDPAMLLAGGLEFADATGDSDGATLNDRGHADAIYRAMLAAAPAAPAQQAAPSLTVGDGAVPEVAESLLLGQAQQLIGALMNHGLIPKAAPEEQYLKLWDVVKGQLRCVNREGGRAALAAQPDAQAEPVARCQYCDDTGDVHDAAGEWRGECKECPAAITHAFKNFHRLLCERFDYTHDEKDWRRDQVSLIEHIASASNQPAQGVEDFDAWLNVRYPDREDRQAEFRSTSVRDLMREAWSIAFGAGCVHGEEVARAALAQAPAAEPLPCVEVYKLAVSVTGKSLLDFNHEQFHALARAVERAHGIGAAKS